MGRDIHFYVERYSSDNDYSGPKDLSEKRNCILNEFIDDEYTEPRWITADSWVEEDDDDYDGEGKKYWTIPREKRFYTGRNYLLFGILVNFYDDIEPLALKRGIPENISSAYRNQLEVWRGDAHTHSYYTLQELLDVDWSKYDKKVINTFLDTIEKMKLLDDDPSKVRCVFFFDN